jgi:hypothetical protein
MNWPRNTSSLLLSACLAALPAFAFADPPATAPSTTLDEQVAQSAGRQQDLKTEVTQAAAQLDTVIAEFDSNGLGDGQDVKTLKAVRNALSRLSGKQMDQVIALLQQARADTDPDKMKNTVAQAYAAQGSVILQMRQIMITCQEQTDLIELSVQFGQLADRQNTALKAAKHLAVQTGGNKANLNEGQIAILQVQQSDEANLRDEVKARLDKLATLVDQVDSATANQLSKVMTAIPPADLLSSLEDASVGLRQTNIFQAAVAERKARDQLRQMARLVAPPRTADQILSDSADAVKVQIEKEMTVVNDSTTNRQNGGQQDVRDQLDDEQGDVVDAIDEVRADIQPLATIPYDTLGDAQKQMQLARSGIIYGNFNGAIAPANLSVAALAQAHQQLLDALAQARQAEIAGQSKLDQAHSLQAGLQELRRQEEQAMAQAKAAKTPALMKAAADRQQQVMTSGQALEPDAADGSEDLAQSLADAIGHMDTAHQDLGKDNTPDNALPEQQAAIDALSRAQTKADAQVAQLQQEDEEAKKLKEASAAVGKLITRQEQEQITTAIVAARPAGKRADDPTATPLPHPPELADKQGKLKDDTALVAGTLPTDVSDAATDLQGAQQSMGDAQTTLNQPDPTHAAAPQQKAVAQLEDAKKAIDQALEQLAQQMDQANTPDQNQQQEDQQAEALVDQAKQAVAQAQQDLNQNKNDAAADQFQQAAMLATQARNAGNDLPPDAKQGLGKAQADLAQGAADAAAEKTPAAQADANQALADLTKADQAMQMADSNLAQQQASDQQGPNQSDLPPTTPGTGESKKPPKPMKIDTNGPRGDTAGGSTFAALPPRDREAITQSQAEKIPEEYGAMIQQYMQNLAEGGKK